MHDKAFGKPDVAPDGRAIEIYTGSASLLHYSIEVHAAPLYGHETLPGGRS